MNVIASVDAVLPLVELLELREADLVELAGNGFTAATGEPFEVVTEHHDLVLGSRAGSAKESRALQLEVGFLPPHQRAVDEKPALCDVEVDVVAGIHPE